MTTTDTTTTRTAKTIAHPFAHLGPAPYRFVGMFRLPVLESFGMNSAGYNNALASLPRLDGGLGSCSHCSMAITYIYVVECADGTKWGVGCDCICKLGSGDAQLVREVKAKKKAVDKAARHERETANLEAGKAWLAENEAALRAIPHPFANRAAKGETYFDYARFVLMQSGTSGKLKMYKAAKKRLAEVEAEATQQEANREMEARTAECARAEAEDAMAWV